MFKLHECTGLELLKTLRHPNYAETVPSFDFCWWCLEMGDCELYQAIKSFTSTSDNELELKKGDVVQITIESPFSTLASKKPGWLLAYNRRTTAKGYVPGKLSIFTHIFFWQHLVCDFDMVYIKANFNRYLLLGNIALFKSYIFQWK